MDQRELNDQVLAVLTKIAPDVDVAGIQPDRAFRDQFDFDSMDFLNFCTALSHHFGLTIEDRDYLRLGSLAGCLSFLGERLRQHGS